MSGHKWEDLTVVVIDNNPHWAESKKKVVMHHSDPMA